MTTAKLNEAFIKEGSEGVDDYYEYDYDYGDISDAEREVTSDRLQEEYLTGVATNPQLQDDIIEMIIDMSTTDTRPEVNSPDFLLYRAGEEDIYQFTSSSHGSVKKINPESIRNWLENKFVLFTSRDTRTPQNAKQVLFDRLIKKIKTLPGFDRFGRVSDEEVTMEGGLATDSLKPILSDFLFRGKKVTTPEKIPMNIKASEIDPARLKTDEQYLEMKKEIEEYMDTYGSRTQLSPLVARLTALSAKGKSRMTVLEVDEYIAKLDLKKYARRDRIYTYWNTKKNLESDLVQKAERFYSLADSIPDSILNGLLDSEMKKAIENYKAQHNSTITQNKFSYIHKFDTDTAQYKKKFQIKTIDDDTEMAHRILAQYMKIDRSDDMSTFAESQGLTPQMVQDSFREGEELAGYEQIEDGQRVGQVGQIDYGNEAPDSEDLQEEIKEFGTGVADPLFFYIYYNQNDKLFQKSAVFLQNWNKIKNEVYYYAKVGGLTKFENDSGMKDLKRHLKKINDEVVKDYSYESENLYLPLTEKLKTEVMDADPRINYSDNDASISKYLQAIEDFLQWGKRADKSRKPTLVNPQQSIVGGTPVRHHVAPGIEGRARDLIDEAEADEVKEDLKDFVSAFRDLLKVVVAYYITPNRSRLLPFDGDMPKWASASYSSFLAYKRDDSQEQFADALKLMLMLDLESAYEAVDEYALNDITRVLEELAQEDLDEDLDDVVDKYEEVVSVLVELFGPVGDVTRQANIEMGASLDENLRLNNIRKEIVFNGRPTSQWKEMFDDLYPKQASDTEKGTILLPLEAVITQVQSIQYAAEDAGSKDADNEVHKRFMSAIRDLNIAKAEIDLKLLDAHDAIRKMADQPIYYNTRKVDNYNHVNSTIEKIEKRFKVNLTPFEIEGIVDERDSHESISKAYGVPTEVVYYVKGNFR